MGDVLVFATGRWLSAITWATTTSHYNADNEPLSSTDADGNVSTYTYNGDGDLLTTTSPPTNEWTAAAETSNDYNANGTICASRTADEVATYGVLSSCSTSHDTYYTYDDAGDLLTTVNPLGDVSTSAYDGDGNQCATLTPDGYAADDTLTSCPGEAEPYETINLTLNVYDEATSTVSPSNAPGGTTWTYYNLNNDQIVSVSVLGNPESCNPLTTFTCLYTSYSSYNPDGDETASVSPTATNGDAGATTTTFYDPDGNQVATVDPAGNLSDDPAVYEQANVNDSNGDDVASTPAASLTADCSVTSTSSLCPNTSYSTYDANGDETASFSPDSAGTGTIASTNTYDPAGNDEASVTATGSTATSTTTNSYDDNGNQLTSTAVGSGGSGLTTGTTTAYEPDGATCWSSTLPWTGDGTPNCADPPLAAGNETSMDYYDQSGNLVAVTAPGPDVNPYASGNTSGCDPLATTECPSTTYYEFNEGGELVTTVMPEDANSDYGVTTTYYDASGNPIAVQGPAGDPGSCDPVTTFTCTDTVYKSYDADGRVNTVTYTDDTPDVTYTYNDDGTRHSMVDGTGTTSYAYSPIGQLVSTANGAGATVTWAYDAADQVICQSYPNEGDNTCTTSGAGTDTPPTGDVTYGYDALGRLASITLWSATGITLTYAYDCAGDVAWVSTGTASSSECDTSTDTDPSPPTSSSAVTTTYGFNGTSGLQSSQATTADGGATNLLSFAFGYDSAGLLNSSTPTNGETALATDNYSYDSDSQVTSGPIAGSGSDSYSYQTPSDLTAGGITADTTKFRDAAYSPSGELCWTANTTGSSCSSPPETHTAYAYDSSGDLLSVTPPSGDDEALTWNAESEELTCVNTDGTTCTTPSESTPDTANYLYNGDGLRTQANTWNGSSTVTADFTWNTTDSALLSDGTFDYVYGDNSNVPVAEIDTGDGVVSDLVADTNSNVRGVVELSSSAESPDTLVNYTDYDAYGDPITENGGSVNSGGLTNEVGSDPDSVSLYGFGGGYADTTGLVYLVNRYYDPATGQFVSVDPDVASTGTPYSYVGDDPIGDTDPLGLKHTRNDNPWHLGWRSKPKRWALAILTTLQLDLGPKDIQAMCAWMQVESSNGWSPQSNDDWNPLSLTQYYDGSYGTNPPINVQSYSSAGDGLYITDYWFKSELGGSYWPQMNEIFGKNPPNSDPGRALADAMGKRGTPFNAAWGGDAGDVLSDYVEEVKTHTDWQSTYDNGNSECDPFDSNLGSHDNKGNGTS